MPTPNEPERPDEDGPDPEPDVDHHRADDDGMAIAHVE